MFPKSFESPVQTELFADPMELLKAQEGIVIPQSLWERLAHSAFRRKFHLNEHDLTYLQNKGLARVLEEGWLFINKRLAAASPKKDGKQTPWKGHPIFVAQHATGNCCRSCLYKWHRIPKGVALSENHKRYMISVLRMWLQMQSKREVKDH